MTPFISSCKPLIVKETPVRDSNFFKKELPGPDNAVAASELRQIYFEVTSFGNFLHLIIEKE